LMQWQKKYKLFLDSRPDLRPLLLSKGIEVGGIYLSHCKQYEPKDLHQIDSLQRRIDAAKRMAGIGQDIKPETPKHKPSEKEREALYLYYTKHNIERSNPLYKLFNKWSKADYRIQSNRSLKSFKSKKGHMEAVRTRVLSEKQNRDGKTAETIKTDIEKLTINYNKKVPG